jgi:hypothetical protein
MGVKPGRWHWGWNVDWGCLRIGCWGEYLGLKRDEGNRGWRKLHNEELNDLHCSPNIVQVIKSKRTRWAGHVVRMVEGRGVCSVLVRKPEGERPLGRPRRRWEVNIKADYYGVRCGLWIGLSWLRIQTGGGHLWMRSWIFGFHKMLGISWLAANRLALTRRTLLHRMSK